MSIVFSRLFELCSSIFLFLVFTTFPLHGYCLGVTDSIKVKADTIAISNSISLGGNRRTGTFSQRVLTASLVSKVKAQKFEFINTTQYLFSKTNGTEVANDWVVLSSMDYQFTKSSKIKPSIFHEYRKNIQYQIKQSHKFHLGMQLEPFDRKRNFSMYAGLGYEYTKYNGETFKNSSKINTNRRFKMAVFHIKNNSILFAKKLIVEYNLFYLQSFRESQDFTFGLIVTINFPLKKGILIGGAYDFRLRNVHLIETSRLNDLLSFSFALDLNSL